MPTVTCPQVEQQLIAESGRIGPDIYKRTLNTSPWLKLVRQGTWPEEMGNIISVLTYERSLPTVAPTWQDVGQSTDISNPSGNPGGGGVCAIPAVKVPFAETLRQYNLQQMAMESPDLCLLDLRVAFQRQAQLGNMMDVLSQNGRYFWIERYRDEYIRLAKHKIVATTGLPESAVGFPAGLPTSILTQGLLRRLYQRLIRDGADVDAYARENSRPVFCLITSSETSENLIKANPEIRQDFRWGDPGELLKPMGVERSYGGFFHLVDDFCPRYDSAGVRVSPYVGAATTKGIKQDINPAYENAPFEASIVFLPSVYESLVPKPLSGVGAAKFDPQTFRGDFQWKNIPDRNCNPDGLIGYFRALFSQGSKPVHPEFGYVILHQRCPVDSALLACQNS